MTAELRVSVPDDVADWLKQQADPGATVSDAVRAYMRAARIDEVLRAAGLELHGPVPPLARPEPAGHGHGHGHREPFAEGRRTLADRGGG
jgi:hypothetical protein